MLQMQMLKMRKGVLRADHPSTLNSMVNFALIYSDQGRWIEAEELQVQVMETSTGVLEVEHLITTLVDHPDRANQLQSLGIEYLDRYQRTEVMTGLEIAIQRFQEALDITSTDHSDRANRFHSLGIRYENKYQRIKAVIDLQTVIKQFQEVLNITSIDYSD